MSSVKALKLAVAVAALVATGSAAQAQDKAALWEGAYVGVHLGGDFGKFSDSTTTTKLSGVLGGLHGGYNWQAGSLVYGIEGDADLSGAKKSVNGAELSNGFLGSLRGRVGYTSGPVLFYGTGGLAMGTLKDKLTNLSVSETRSGYVLGLGLEYAIAPNMSARIEGLHYGFKDVFKDQFGSGIKYEANVVRAGLSYKF
jgi:outer membrane immunogenic protein